MEPASDDSGAGRRGAAPGSPVDLHRPVLEENGVDTLFPRREPSMSQSTPFPEFIRRIRAGNDEAARELVRRYEPVIRREVRVRVRDPQQKRDRSSSMAGPP
jgi:hypothetical protein